MAAPVEVAGALWGAIVVADTRVGQLADPEVETRLAHFADLVALAIANAEARDRLTAQALTDPLTGLANHRALHERLAEEAARARRHGTPLSVIMLDLDDFTEVNNRHGHQAGDRVLAAVAERLKGAVRREDMVARVGGEEFAVVLPGTAEGQALQLANRMCEVVRGRPFVGVGHVTISGGVCGTERAGEPEELLRLADGALYWAKAHGRDRAYLYDPEVVVSLSGQERAEKELRTRAMASLAALAQAVDAKDHSTREHSDRVAEIAVLVARRLGWGEADLGRMREAALLHDVGKIGVPDHILLKAGPLTPAEYRQVMIHAPLGASIVADVLDPEQVLWVRHHHERWDGGGYPDGLEGASITPGARVLAIADAWDAMTADRPYRDGLPLVVALEECRRQSGHQFAPEVVDAIAALAEEGVLGQESLQAA